MRIRACSRVPCTMGSCTKSVQGTVPAASFSGCRSGLITPEQLSRPLTELSQVRRKGTRDKEEGGNRGEPPPRFCPSLLSLFCPHGLVSVCDRETEKLQVLADATWSGKDRRNRHPFFIPPSSRPPSALLPLFLLSFIHPPSIIHRPSSSPRFCRLLFFTAFTNSLILGVEQFHSFF